MHIVQRIIPPGNSETAELYARGFRDDELPAGHVISFDSYFNSFHEQAFLRYCDFGSLSYEFRLHGDFRVTLFRGRADENENHQVEQIEEREVSNCNSEKPERIALPTAKPGHAGRVYAELTCLKDGGRFSGGRLISEKSPVRAVSLAVVICTFRKEDFVRRTVSALTGDAQLGEKKLDVFIADNAGTLDPADTEFSDPRVRILPGKNAGGAGGFTRGLLEAYENSEATHFLVMDDDVDLESESIFRLITFYEYSTDNAAVAGAMLNLSEKTRQVTAGTLYDRAQDTGEQALFAMRNLDTHADLTAPDVLTRINGPRDVDYGGFWFFAFDRAVLTELGFPLPFFIKGDDAEFGIRAGAIRDIAVPPSLCVWHEPPERKPLSWEIYYHYRNALIVHALHYPHGRVKTLSSLTKYFLHALFTYHYNFCELMLRALRDYQRGAEYLCTLDPEKVHGEIRALAGKHASGGAADHSALDTENPPAAGLLRRLAALATLGGHLPPLPGGRKERALPLNDINWFSVFPARAYIARHPFAGEYEFTRRPFIGILLWARFAWRTMVLTIRWSSLGKSWRKSRGRATSAAMWKRYLGLGTNSERH